MFESAGNFHNLEWPSEGARLAGPIVWLRGWVVGKPGHDCIDLRVRHDGRTHLGVLGLPRTDLAAHFQSARAWLPAEFILGVPVPDGPVTLTLEVMDAHGGWHELQSIPLNVAPDGLPPPRVEGRLEHHAGGTWTVRDAHHPFHGHLDQPGPAPAIAHGRAPVFGWLLDETQPITTVLATTDTLVYNHLEHSLSDDALAAKVPEYQAARHARLRGEVDFPATLIQPACLRVYAVSPDGSVHLCFAQRLQAAACNRMDSGGTRPPRSTSSGPRASRGSGGLENPATNQVRPEAGLHPPATAGRLPGFPPLPARSLPALPSGRPRRLLLVIRGLLPNDATLRALDLAGHLTASHRWAARVVSTEDGPLREAFEQAGAESLIVNPGPLFAAVDPAAAERALAALERQIRWDHLDAVAVFDPDCGWALALARRHRIPSLFDCSADEPMEPDPTASPAVQSLLRDSWRSATSLCFSSAAAARAQGGLLGTAGKIIPHWHSPTLPAPVPGKRPTALAPLRTADWLTRHHPETAARWNFRQGPAGRTATERLARRDDAFNLPGLDHADNWAVTGLSLCLGPLFQRGPLRPLLDAAAAGVPLVAPRRPTTQEIFAGTGLPLVAEDNPLALAHALLAADAQPGFLRRETTAAQELIRTRHAPQDLLPLWETLLATVAASDIPA